MSDNQNYQYSPDRQPQQNLVTTTTTTHLLQKQLTPQTNNHQVKNDADNHQQDTEKQIKQEEQHLPKDLDEKPSPETTPKNYQNNFLGRLTSKDNILFISQNLVEIGRNSSKSSVDYNVGKNSFISRKHLQIQHSSGEFVLVCLSKNGVFVDGVFQRKTSEPLKLSNQCTLRFPSTNIRIQFENLINQNVDTKNNIKTENSNLFYSPLKITIPELDGKSPFPSPTGTISAVNSCPTSPRQGYPEYPSYANINQNNNNNNFQNEMFQPPSTSSYSEHEKPPYSYAQLIVQSISASPEKQLTLSGIYSFISKNYPYYRTGANKGWQNSIRHNLSLNRYFIKVPRSQDEPGKGSFWRIDPNSEMKLIDSSYRKRRQRGSQCFRSPFGMPRSAPVSPSHIDNSRENSPLHDITMQSAPGSPGVHYHSMHNDNHEEGTNYPAQTIIQQTPYSSHQFK